MHRVSLSDTNIVSPTPDSSISTSNYTETPQVRRRGGRPRLTGRPSTLNNDITNAPRRRRGRPSSLVPSSSVGQYVGQASNNTPVIDEQITIVSHNSGSTVNNEYIYDSNRPTPRMIVSSRTVVDIDGNPLHSAIVTNPVPFPISSSNLHPATTTTNLDIHICHHPNSTSNYSETPQVRRRPGRPRLRGRPSTLNDDITNPPRRRRRTSSLVASSSDGQYVGQTSEHAPVNNDHTTIVSHSSGHMSSYWDCGNAEHVCVHCQAMVWYGERNHKTYSPCNPQFSICCSLGKVKIPFLQHPPQPLRGLLDYKGEQKSKVFRQNIKLLNAMFSFTSTGGKVNTSINDGRGPYTFRLNGHNHHRIGSLLPTHDDGRPRFAQLYIYDTDNEIDNRFYALHKGVPSTSDEIILRSLVQDFILMLDQNNSLVQAFRMAKERFNVSSMQPVKLQLIGTRKKDGRQYNLPSASEVAALIPGDGNPTDHRDVLIEERGGNIKRISELHPSFMALQYPLLFPYGEDGFHLNIPLNTTSSSRTRKNVSLREYYCFRLHVRKNEGKTLHKAGRLFHTYVVDAYSAVLDNDLDWYRRNQNKIRSDLYNGLHDRVCIGETSCESIGRRVILPASFTGGPRYMIQQYQDAMAICRWAGTPDLFITMTSNPRWPEIERHVQETIPGQPTCDRPDIIARMFKIKLDELMKDIRKNNHFGSAKAVVYTIEFQKRGLPHCHALVFLDPDDKISTPDKIDQFISAELPSELNDPIGFEAVRTHMMHGPCGQLNPSSPCMYNNQCSKGYPKTYCDETFIRRDGWPCYKRSNNGAKVQVGHHDIMLDNRFVVPHNRDLLVKYGCHINVEWCNQGMLVKYLFSYLNKGPDCATVLLEGQNSRTPYGSLLNHNNEIEEYINCRYISASESCWRLFAFDMHYRSVPVERLPFHEEGCNTVYFRDNDQLEYVVRKPTSAMSKFTEWMTANQLFPEGRGLTYTEFPTKFTWHGDAKSWMPRKNGFAIGRIYYVSPSMGETYYLRMLLNVVRGPLCFKDIRTVDGVVHPTYMFACKALSLLGDDVEWSESIRDACQWQFGNQVRELFVTILLFCMVNDHAQFFSDSFPYLSEDVVYNQRRLLQNGNVLFSDDEVRNYTLIELEKILNGNNRSLVEFPNLPQISHLQMIIGQNRLIAGERTYDISEERMRFIDLYSRLNTRQMEVYSTIMNAVGMKSGGVFFVSGSGGTGKTYLWKTLIASIRSHGKIVLSVASSGIASLLLPGGRTSHSRFRIPIAIDKDSCCSIDVGSDLAELINVSELIIWDEAPLQHRHAFEAVDRTFRDVCRHNAPEAEHQVFGGKVVVLGGDFRQILPVIPSAPRSEIVASVVNKSSTIWDACKVFVLTTNMRLHDPTIEGDDLIEMQQFSKWILDMGAGRLPAIALAGEDDATWITIPDDLLIPIADDPIEAVVSSTFPDISNRLNDISYLKERCILCPTNDAVDTINSHVLKKMPGEMHELLSADEICASTENLEEMQIMYPSEFLNTLRFSGIPNHQLELKVGAPIILLRNINLQKGLCNGTRLVVTQISRRVIEAVIITGTHAGEKTFIGRIDMTPTETSWPFDFKRRQFPIKVCFAMTINKSQGQTFNYVCAYLVKPVFAHGQLYVTASRVTSRAGLRFYVDNDGKCDNNLSKNVVYKEVFYNFPLDTTDNID